MLRLRRRCAQTARISLHSYQCQRARTQKQPNRQSLGASCSLASRVSCGSFRCRPAGSVCVSASGPFRWGGIYVRGPGSARGKIGLRDDFLSVRARDPSFLGDFSSAPPHHPRPALRRAGPFNACSVD